MKKNNWIYKVFLWTFLLAMAFSGISNAIANNFNYIFLIITIVLIIFIGIIFDIIGVATLSCDEAAFHAKATKKIHGSKEVIKLLKNGAKVASFCNDIIGDICGIVSGGLGAVLAIYISANIPLNITIVTLIISALISSLTVGGKAIGKSIAIKNANKIMFIVGKIIYRLKLKNKY